MTHPEPSSANDLLQARLRGTLSRRALIEHAARLGLSAPVVGLLLTYGNDNRAAAAVTETTPASKPSKPDGRALRGGSLNVGVVGVIDSLNPYLTALNGPSFDILSGVMEGLLAFNAKQDLKPALAESFEISDDGVVYTFKLRPGVAFHNGDEFTAEDVIETWRMLIDEDFPAWQRVGWDKIDSIEAPDPLTVVITTSVIYAPFLSNISAGAFTNAVIAPRSLLSQGPGRFVREFTDPVGTGPMRFVERRGNQFVLARNDAYWGEPARLNQIVVNVYQDYQAQLEALRVGEIDLVAHTGTIGASLREEAMAIDGITVFEYPGQTWANLDLKQISFLRETEVRQALDYATPTDRIIEEVLDGEAIRAVADQSPGSWVYDDEMRPRSYNLERAAGLLDRVGIELNAEGVRERGGELFRIQLWAESSDPQAPAILKLVSESWEQLGILTETKFARSDLLWGPMGYQFSDRMTAGYNRWGNVNDPDNMWYWHSSQIPTSPGAEGGNTPAFFNEFSFQERIDELTLNAAAETNRRERKKLYQEIQRLLQKEVPVIFFFWDKNYSAAAAKIGGFWPSAFTYLLWNCAEWYLTE